MRNGTVRLFATCCALWCAACGGTEDSERPQALPSSYEPVDLTDCESFAEDYEFLLLEPFTPNTQPVNDNGTRTLGWYVSYDLSNVSFNDDGTVKERFFGPPDEGSTVEGQIWPDDTEGAPSLDEGKLCEQSAGSIHLYSNPPGFSHWGMNFGSNMNDNYDATEWGADGIAFWTKRAADTHEGLSVKATVPDGYTTSSGRRINSLEPYCIDGLYDQDACDAYGRAVILSDEWQLHLLRFDEMYQEGFGRASPLPTPNVEALAGVAFLVGTGTWDVWVDEVAYFRER